MKEAATYLLTYKQILAESLAELLHDKTNYANAGAFLLVGLWQYFGSIMEVMMQYDDYVTIAVGLSVIAYNGTRTLILIFDKAKNFFNKTDKKQTK